MARRKERASDTSRRERHGETCMCRRCRGREEAILRDKRRYPSLREVAHLYEEDEK